jgi:hypothetical protein
MQSTSVRSSSVWFDEFLVIAQKEVSRVVDLGRMAGASCRDTEQA